MIPLRGRAVAASLAGPLRRRLWRIVGTAEDLQKDPASAAVLVSTGTVLTGAALALRPPSAQSVRIAGDVVDLPDELGHLSAGDIVDITPDGSTIHVVWRQSSEQNFMLLTERCDNYCLMCCQPPKKGDDSWLLNRASDLVRLLPADTSGFTLTGGEPTLYGQDLLDLLHLITEQLPNAEVHLLSNGRRFADPAFASGYASIGNPRLMTGIPLYAPESSLHDYVVQAEGAFDETIRGLLNLAQLGQRIEIRVVIQRVTVPRLVELAEFIARNLPFVDQVALMGLEIMGLARGNLEEIWIDPYDYRAELREACEVLDGASIHTMVYNHQLCLLEPTTRPFAIKSISDWKNEYDALCDPCDLRSDCGGFFHSAKYRTSDHIRPVNLTQPALMDAAHPVGSRGRPVVIRSHR